MISCLPGTYDVKLSERINQVSTERSETIKLAWRARRNMLTSIPFWSTRKSPEVWPQSGKNSPASCRRRRRLTTNFNIWSSTSSYKLESRSASLRCGGQGRESEFGWSWNTQVRQVCEFQHHKREWSVDDACTQVPAAAMSRAHLSTQEAWKFSCLLAPPNWFCYSTDLRTIGRSDASPLLARSSRKNHVCNGARRIRRKYSHTEGIWSAAF